jgi:hypothetical protein
MNYIHKSWRNDPVHLNSNKATNKVLEMVDEGLLDPRGMLLMALKLMGEDSVVKMCEANEIGLEDEESN